MNIIELISKNDPNILVQVWDSTSNSWSCHEDPKSIFKKLGKPKVNILKFKPELSEGIVRGLVLFSGMRVVVKQASKFWQNFAKGDGVFKFSSVGPKKGNVIIGWGLDNKDELIQQRQVEVDEKLRDIAVQSAPGQNLDLIVQVPLQKGVKLFFGIHRVLDRKELYIKCKGNGVEIGPGPKPQIYQSNNTTVKYIEQSPPEKWHELYGKETKVPVDRDLWKHYVIGSADDIPAEDCSLDFIFSSHVIEHLANPLGHFTYWGKKLKSNGIIVAVIPDKSSCKDYVFNSSTIEELEAEYLLGSMKPTIAHFQRWSEFRLPSVSAHEIMDSGRSIHVHFYTPESMEAVLKKMHKKLGFQRYRVKSEYNHKDFFVILEK